MGKRESRETREEELLVMKGKNITYAIICSSLTTIY